MSRYPNRSLLITFRTKIFSFRSLNLLVLVTVICY